MDGPSRFDGHPPGHLIGWSHQHAQSRISTFQHSMPHDRSGPDGLHTQAITDPAKSVYRCLRRTPTVQYTLHTKAQKWSAARLHCLSALFRRFAILSSGPSVGPLLKSVIVYYRPLPPPSSLHHPRHHRHRRHRHCICLSSCGTGHPPRPTQRIKVRLQCSKQKRWGGGVNKESV